MSYTPQPWRLTDYYPESYARLMDILSDGIVPDWDDDDHNRHEAEFRADLAAHDAEVRAQALREAASAPIPRAALNTRNNGLRQWLRARADRIERGE